MEILLKSWAKVLAKKDSSIGQPNFLIICEQFEVHWGNPHGKRDLTNSQCCLCNVELMSWECKLGNVNLKLGNVNFVI
jgi:hypothetical protein